MRTRLLDGGRVVIVGGGIIGASIAFHLGARGYDAVTIVERNRAGEGATAHATGGIRHQFSSQINIELVKRSRKSWDNFRELTGAPLDFRQHGYLFLISEPDTLHLFEQSVALQRSLGVDVSVLEVAQVAEVFPGVRTDDLLGATYSADDGSASPADAVAGFLRGARRSGTTILQGTEFLGLENGPSGEVRGVRTSEGVLEAELVVIAAGPQTQAVGDLCGVNIPVVPHPRQAFAATGLDTTHTGLPLAVDMATGAYLHPETSGSAVIGGNDRDAASSDRATVDWSRVESLVAALAHRFPRLEGMEIPRGWAGLREMTPDDHAIVGPVDEVPGLWVAAGFSGHGFMQSPAVGEELAQWWLDGQPELDLGPLRLKRFAADMAADLERAVF